MNKIILISFLLLISKSKNFKCGYNEIKKPKIKIKNKSKINETNRILDNSTHEIRIEIVTSILETQLSNNEISEDYYSNITLALNKTISYLEKLINTTGINFYSISEEYFDEENDYILRNELKNEYKINRFCDLILIPKIYFLGFGIDAAAYAIAIDDLNNRPFLGAILLGYFYDFSQLNSQEYLIMLLLHEITHILGFSNILYDYYINNSTKIIVKNNKILFHGENVIKKAKKHFNCDLIEGIELENQGSSGSYGVHWDSRIMLTDYMIAIDYPDIVISDITLGLLEDTGWYTVNYYTGGLFRFGKNEGCEFLNSKCIDNGYNKFNKDFCIRNNIERCTSSYLSRGYCEINEYDSEIDKEFQYFKNPSLGGFYYANYCPVIIYYDYYYFNSRCDLNSLYNNNYPYFLGEKFSEKSICFLSSLVPNFYNESNYNYKRTMCYEIECNFDNKNFIVKIGDDKIICSGKYENITVDGYNGFIICPNFNRVCTGSVYCNNALNCIDKKSVLIDYESNNDEGKIEDEDDYEIIEKYFIEEEEEYQIEQIEEEENKENNNENIENDDFDIIFLSHSNISIQILVFIIYVICLI